MAEEAVIARRDANALPCSNELPRSRLAGHQNTAMRIYVRPLRVCHFRILLSGIQARPELDPREKHSGVANKNIAHNRRPSRHPNLTGNLSHNYRSKIKQIFMRRLVGIGEPGVNLCHKLMTFRKKGQRTISFYFMSCQKYSAQHDHCRTSLMISMSLLASGNCATDQPASIKAVCLSPANIPSQQERTLASRSASLSGFSGPPR